MGLLIVLGMLTKDCCHRLGYMDNEILHFDTCDGHCTVVQRIRQQTSYGYPD